MQQQTDNNFTKRLNGIPESWNIEATKNNFVLNNYIIKDVKKIENDIKNEEIKKFVSFKSQYVPENWNLYATYNQSLNKSHTENIQQKNKNRKYKNYSSIHENMTNILNHNKSRNRHQQAQLQRQLQLQQDNEARARTEKYFNDNRHQFVELGNIKKPKELFKYNKNKVNIFDRLNQRKQEQVKQQTIQPFIE